MCLICIGSFHDFEIILWRNASYKYMHLLFYAQLAQQILDSF